MNVEELIREYIASLPEPRQSALRELHRLIVEQFPDRKLWFEDGKNAEGKVVANPSVGYGAYMIQYADGSSREFYRIGLSANKTGISVYVLGLEDKTYLTKTFGEAIGKASVTGYCIRFKKVGDIRLETLLEAIRFGLSAGKEAE